MMDGSVGGSNSPAPFLTKTYDMLEDPSTNSIVAWSYSAKSFIVRNHVDFAKDLLPKYFKHNNFASFVRQLNTYGFRKVDPGQWEFANDEFVRGKRHLLKNIHRRRPTHSHSLQHGALTNAEKLDLQDEIEKLKRDKAMLFSDLQQDLQKRREIEKQIESLERRLKIMKRNEQNMMTMLEQIMERSTESSFFSSIVMRQNQGKKRTLSKTDLFCQDFVGMDEDNKMILAVHPSNDIAASAVPMLEIEPFDKMESTLYSLEKLIRSASQASGEVFANGITVTDPELCIDVNTHPCSPSSLVDSMEIVETANQVEITPSHHSIQTQTQMQSNISEIDVNSEPPFLPPPPAAASELCLTKNTLSARDQTIPMTGGDEERRSVNHVDNDHRVEISVEDKVAVGEKVACGCGVSLSVSFSQKIIAEFIGTYFLIFAGCASVILNLMKGTVTLPGISIVWGLVVMVMIFSVGHISGAHFNPAVTIAFATVGRFPWQQVPAYISAQVFASILASGTLRLIFGGSRKLFAGTTPDGSDIQSFVLEFIATFYLMFVISSVGTDIRAFGKFAGIAIGDQSQVRHSIRRERSVRRLSPTTIKAYGCT